MVPKMDMMAGNNFTHHRILGAACAEKLKYVTSGVINLMSEFVVGPSMAV